MSANRGRVLGGSAKGRLPAGRAFEHRYARSRGDTAELTARWSADCHNIDVDVGRVRYARNGAVRLAYRVMGDGETPLVLVPGFVSNVDLFDDRPGSSTASSSDSVRRVASSRGISAATLDESRLASLRPLQQSGLEESVLKDSDLSGNCE
jgi:hypothetical protein